MRSQASLWPDLIDELEEARRERDEARAEADRWHARYEAAVEMYQRASQSQYQQQMLQAAQSMQAQLNAQSAMNATNFYSQLGQVPQSAFQGLHNCTCVPGRADALLGGDLP
jgi:F0F1-type ATP synthase membrane subunit b/b'